MWRITAFDRDGREVARLDANAGEVSIGRDNDRQLVLPSASVSRKHARLVLDGPQPYILDEGSANGVIVNGVRIAGPTAVVPGVRVDIAEFHLEFELPQAPIQHAAPMTQAVAPISERLPHVAPDSGGGEDDPIRLVAEGGPFDGHIYDVPHGELGVGRAVDNEIVLDDPSLSRKHARVRRAGGGRIELEDLGSSNGTFVNGRRVGKGSAGPGDTVRFGELSFRVEGPIASGTRSHPPASNNGWILWAAAVAVVVLLGAGAAVFFLRKPASNGGGAGNSEEIAVAKLKSGKEKLAEKKFDAALADFSEAIRLDPINAAEARRLKVLAEGEPQNEKTMKKVLAQSALGDRSSIESAVRSFGQIPPESGFRLATGQKLSKSLVTFGEAQCKAKKWLDCAWAVCKAYDVAPPDSHPGSDATATLKDAEKHLARDKSYTPCKKH